jgi:3-oxoacyl-[acyl-carrier protein] reductase
VGRILITNVLQYGGPGTIPVLLREGHQLVCHDQSFTDRAARAQYMREHPGTVCVAAQEPEDIYREAIATHPTIDALVSNDVHPSTRNAIEEIRVDDLRATLEALLVFPVRLTQLLLPAMKQRRAGTFVFVTSARPRRPEPGFATPTSVRAASTAFAMALAKETAPHGIQVNVVAPNYLYSEMYYPRVQFIDDPEGRQYIARTVPAGRLGTPQEFGELVAFLVSGRSPFTTGQVIDFTGGWP